MEDKKVEAAEAEAEEVAAVVAAALEVKEPVVAVVAAEVKSWCGARERWTIYTRHEGQRNLPHYRSATGIVVDIPTGSTGALNRACELQSRKLSYHKRNRDAQIPYTGTRKT